MYHLVNSSFECSGLDVVFQHIVRNIVSSTRRELIECCFKQLCAHVILQTNITWALLDLISPN
jgi:hypothetical protein